MGASEIQLVDAADHYQGTITLNAVLTALDADVSTPVESLAAWDTAVLRAGMSIATALQQAESDESGILPVLASTESDRLVGVIAQARLVRAYRETLGEIRREEHAVP